MIGGVGAGTTESTKVFISYSRTDREVAERVARTLRERRFGVLRDIDDILPTEEWKGRLQQLITEADAVVFLLSPSSAASDVCAWEVDIASNLGKKIAPIIIDDVPGQSIPPMLSRLNYIFATQRDRFDNAIETLCDALGTDIEWIREHTRQASLAARWDATGRPTEALLRAQELEHAEDWLASRPPTAPSPAQVCIQFVASSRDLNRLQAVYTELRLEALDAYVRPILESRLVEQQGDAARTYRPNLRYETQAEQIKSDMETIRNFLTDAGSWHPQPAIHQRNLGPQEDYLEVYGFPCCGKTVLSDTLTGRISQYRADGCAERP